MTASPTPRRPRRRPRRAGACLALTAAALAVAGPAFGPTASPGPFAAPAPEPAARYVLDGSRTLPQEANGPLEAPAPESDLDRVKWRKAAAVGTHSAGSMRGCVRLPASGRTYVTWDPVLRETPNRADRRCATRKLVLAVLEVAAGHSKDHPGAPRMIVGDLSRPGGGSFGVEHGDLGDGEGHVSHQNGLDVDVYYPRRDGRERGSRTGGPDDLMDLDHRLAQDLVDRFVAAGAEKIFVGPRSGLTGPPGVVVALRRHEDHMHVRLPR